MKKRNKKRRRRKKKQPSVFLLLHRTNHNDEILASITIKDHSIKHLHQIRTHLRLRRTRCLPVPLILLLPRYFRSRFMGLKAPKIRASFILILRRELHAHRYATENTLCFCIFLIFVTFLLRRVFVLIKAIKANVLCDFGLRNYVRPFSQVIETLQLQLCLADLLRSEKGLACLSTRIIVGLSSSSFGRWNDEWKKTPTLVKDPSVRRLVLLSCTFRK